MKRVSAKYFTIVKFSYPDLLCLKIIKAHGTIICCQVVSYLCSVEGMSESVTVFQDIKIHKVDTVVEVIMSTVRHGVLQYSSMV